jgi:signal transduction histidine kinase
MGNRLIASINNLNLALVQPTYEDAMPFIDSASTYSTASLMTLRKIVEGLSPIDFSKSRLISLIESVVNRISAAGVYADLQMTGELDALPVPVKEFLYNVCQEALTNSIIHGKAENIIIKMDYADDMLRVNIVDDGRGCENISKNNGLTTMENRAKLLEGKIGFASPSTGGFGIYTEIPVKPGDQI